jgi:7-cyano-7-deazaguanine synthase
VSGLVAAAIDDADGGIMQDLPRLLGFAKDRGRDGVGIYAYPPGSTGDEKVESKINTVTLALQAQRRFDFLACAYGAPATKPFSKGDVPPFKYENWTVIVDGAVSNCDATGIPRLMHADGFYPTIEQLGGQFAIVAIDRKRPGMLFWAAKAKPLYGLYDELARGVFISSDRSHFDGMYHPVRHAQPVELGPYEFGTMSVSRGVEVMGLPRERGRGSLILCGGGLDSVVAAFDTRGVYSNEPTRLLFFDYAQQALAQEYDAVCAIAHYIGAQVETIPLDFFRHINTPLVGGTVNKQPTAGVASEWVPARNTAFMALAMSYAEANGFARIICGINQDAASAYPDNEVEWLRRLRRVTPYALGTNRAVELHAPLQAMTKTQIVRHGDFIGVPWEKVSGWSCYEGGSVHCGECSSCRARRGAFANAKVQDPTSYAKG